METTETVEYKGKLYQIGAMYEFSDDGDDWTTDILMELSEDVLWTFKTIHTGWRFIREYRGSIGTVIQAPVKLIDGAIYLFDDKLNGGICWVGFYSTGASGFLMNTGDASERVARVVNVSNIRLLVEA